MTKLKDDTEKLIRKIDYMKGYADAVREESIEVRKNLKELFNL